MATGGNAMDNFVDRLLRVVAEGDVPLAHYYRCIENHDPVRAVELLQSRKLARKLCRPPSLALVGRTDNQYARPGHCLLECCISRGAQQGFTRGTYSVWDAFAVALSGRRLDSQTCYAIEPPDRRLQGSIQRGSACTWAPKAGFRSLYSLR